MTDPNKRVLGVSALCGVAGDRRRRWAQTAVLFCVDIGSFSQTPTTSREESRPSNSIPNPCNLSVRI